MAPFIEYYSKFYNRTLGLPLYFNLFLRIKIFQQCGRQHDSERGSSHQKLRFRCFALAFRAVGLVRITIDTKVLLDIKVGQPEYEERLMQVKL